MSRFQGQDSYGFGSRIIDANCYLEVMSRHQRGHVHQTLRCDTSAAHHTLDHHRLMRRLTANELTREQYAESLEAMYRPHARLERLVHESHHHFESGLSLSPRIELLKSDLCEMDRSVPPVSQFPPGPSDGRAAWWGRVYVLEGSRRGSAVIARCIQSSLGGSVPCRFFGDPKARDDLSALLLMLEYELNDGEALEQAVASAQAAFATYKAELDAFDSGVRGVEMR